ncbi:MAG: hypothetical protein R3C56_37350 [Pirellulaceae bacterium]
MLPSNANTDGDVFKCIPDMHFAMVTSSPRPAGIGYRAAAQEPAAEATATQVDSKVGDIEAVLGQGEEASPARHCLTQGSLIVSPTP